MFGSGTGVSQNHNDFLPNFEPYLRWNKDSRCELVVLVTGTMNDGLMAIEGDKETNQRIVAQRN